MSESEKEICHRYKLCKEFQENASENFKISLKTPVKLYVDNQSAILIAKNPIWNNRTKHIDLRHHYLRDLRERKIIEPTKVKRINTSTEREKFIEE